jgi:hypothetical protein
MSNRRLYFIQVYPKQLYLLHYDSKLEILNNSEMLSVESELRMNWFKFVNSLVLL